MNDPHDNAATDREMLIRIETESAIQAYRTAELAQLRLEQAEYELETAMKLNVDMPHYLKATAHIKRRIHVRRRRMIAAGKLPPEGLDDKAAVE